MSTTPGSHTPLQETFAALRHDLVQENGPQISPIRNYRFAIVQYAPADEFKVRGEVQRLSAELIASGWMVLPIDLQKLLLDRVRALGPRVAERLIEREKELAAVKPERGLEDLKQGLRNLIEGPDGIASDCSRIICDYVSRNPDRIEHTLALIGRAGALYPFFRSSALLRHLDGRTRNVPVVLLYPGERRGQNALSFMGVLGADNDYRPRIYP